MTRRRIAIALLLAIAPVILTAQSPGSLGTDGRGLAEALRLGNAGQTAAARLTIDSMIKITPPDAFDFADLLFARATFALNALDAGLDYQRIINDFPASEKRKESLLRVAQRALLTGESAKALDYLGIRSSEYADDASLAVTDYWKARAHFDSHDVRAACDALRDGKLHAKNSGAGSLAELEALSSASCAMTPSAATTVADSQPVKIATTTPKVKTDTSAAARVFAVQVSAFDRRADADAASGRLRKNGLDAHVDGTARPFRVRIGRYATFAEAAKKLRELKARGISGFVAEMVP